MKPSRSPQEELERLGRALRTLSGSNRALLRADDEASLLQEICRVVVDEAGYRVAVVGRAEHDDRRSITALAQVTREEKLADLRALTWADTELGQSATGTAIRTGQPCLINDILNDPLPPFWREFARQRGFGSIAVAAAACRRRDLRRTDHRCAGSRCIRRAGAAGAHGNRRRSGIRPRDVARAPSAAASRARDPSTQPRAANARGGQPGDQSSVRSEQVLLGEICRWRSSNVDTGSRGWAMPTTTRRRHCARWLTRVSTTAFSRCRVMGRQRACAPHAWR